MTKFAKRRIRKLRLGLSYVEVVACVPLVGLVLVGAMNTTGAIVGTWTVAQDQQRGATLAEHLMAEVLQQYYEDPNNSGVFGRESGEAAGNRTAWDDVDDYDSWSSSPPRGRDNAVLSGYDGWTREVSVSYMRLSDPTQTSATDEGLKGITVTVIDPTGQSTSLTAYRSKWGAMEEAPLSDTTFQSYVSHEMELGNGSVFYGGAQVPNHSEDE